MRQILAPFLAVALASAALVSATIPVAEFKASGESETTLAFDDGCGPADYCAYDGTTDFAGTSGGVSATTDAGSQQTYTISGSAVNAWEGTGTRNVAVATTLRVTSGGTSGSASSISYGAVGWTLEITYEGDAGTVDQVFGLSPQPHATTTTVAVDEYDGQLTTVTLRLQCATKATLSAETLNTSCHLAQFWLTVSGSARIPL